MFATQVGIGRRAHCRLLRGDGTATAEVASAALARIVGDSLPEQAENDEIAMLLVHTGASEFNQLRADRLERTEVELLLAVVATIRRRSAASLQTIRANDLAGGQMLDDQVIANFIEWIGV